MPTITDDILAAIERRGLADGVPVEHLDTHVADVLGVPPDHYAAWQLVGGAIASYASAHHHDAEGGLLSPPHVATVAGQLSRLWEQLGRVHQASVTGVPGERQVRELIGELFVLTDWLLADGGDRDAVGVDDVPDVLADLASDGGGR